MKTATHFRAEATSKSTSLAAKGSLLAFVGCMLVILLLLFAQSLHPQNVLFSNDGPLGPLSSEAASLPEIFTGYWGNLNWVGNANPSAAPNISWLTLWLAGPVGYSKFFAPLSVFLLGLAACFFFRQLGFHPAVCAAGGIAAALNSDFFSYACWGLGSLTLTVAAVFTALAILVTPRSRPWIKAALAGLAVGLAIMEGYDNGAIFSLYIAAFVIFQAMLQNHAPTAARLGKGILRTAIVAVFAAYLAAQTLATLIGTQVKGIEGAQQDARARQQKWDAATQWSFPRIETLRILIPGLYGYRMDTPNGGNYWGAMGRDAAWEQYFESDGKLQPPSGGMLRHSGSGPYAGVFVVLLAFWAVAQTFRKKDPTFTAHETKHIWFWAGTAVVSLLLAYGRYAPLYQIIYALPYFSTIRIPAKFLHAFHVALVILFGFGLHGLWKRYISAVIPTAISVREQIRLWWKSAPAFDRKWTGGMLAVLSLSVLGLLIYSSSRTQLVQHLQNVGFAPESGYPMELVSAMASFSIAEVGWFVLFLGLSMVIVVLLLSGALSGARARWAAVIVVLFLAMDLVRANSPWILYYDYKQKYSSNPIIEVLRDKAHERRVTAFFYPVQQLAGQANPQQLQQLAAIQGNLQQIYHIEWLQHHFQYYDIQSLDIIQMPRMPADTAAYRAALANAPLRLWQLTNTRLILALSGFVDFLNQNLDPGQNRFRLHTSFNLSQEQVDSPILVQTNSTGPYGLIEFTGALPRSSLYTHWQTITNDSVTLQQLVDPAFKPETTVLVADTIPAPSTSTNAPIAAGSVSITEYTPKRVRLKAHAAAPSVLLLNDKFHPDWKVQVDGKPQPTLRCNHLMRGVYLEPGEHDVEFRFQPPSTGLYVSLSALAVGIALIGLLFVGNGAKLDDPKCS